MQEMTFALAAKTFFGFKPGQSMAEFMQELKELTQQDREYFKREFVKVGITISN